MKTSETIPIIEALLQECIELEQQTKKLSISLHVARLEENDDDAFWFEQAFIAAHRHYEAACRRIVRLETGKAQSGKGGILEQLV